MSGLSARQDPIIKQISSLRICAAERSFMSLANSVSSESSACVLVFAKSAFSASYSECVFGILLLYASSLLNFKLTREIFRISLEITLQRASCIIYSIIKFTVRVPYFRITIPFKFNYPFIIMLCYSHHTLTKHCMEAAWGPRAEGYLCDLMYRSTCFSLSPVLLQQQSLRGRDVGECDR